MRRRFIFKGIIQGVGFRPTVYRAAARLSLGGFVQNCRSEVIAELEGPDEKLDQFEEELRATLPRAARIESLKKETIPEKGETDFRIAESGGARFTFPPIPPDLCICEDCKRELLNPKDRRYLYPFITCTQCGPRYSIVTDTPFDRERSSMAYFIQCDNCTREYTDPYDRRFHSQTNSCGLCGPQYFLENVKAEPIAGDPIKEAIRAIGGGKVVAVQGIGGFHLAVDPRSPKAVKKLRGDKERERKPFALMVRNINEARRLCVLTKDDAALLCSPEAPILILPKKNDIPAYLDLVSDTATLGLMPPYTPLHVLLFHHPEMDISYSHLIMTSGNLKGEPIITKIEEAREKLRNIADLFLYHNREIVFRTDDSVIRNGGEKIFLRRSRGFVPRTIKLRKPVPSISLAAGGDLKSAPALAIEDEVYLAPYLGDIETAKTEEAFTEQVEKMLSLYNVRPQRLIYDLHPGYFSSRWAMAQDVPQKIPIQHHFAHILSVMAEHGLDEVLGLSFDGTGYGTDGSIWGGEFLNVRRDGFRRLGCFRPFPLPGGDAAIVHPKRISTALLNLGGFIATDAAGRNMNARISEELGLSESELRLVVQMLEKDINCPRTSSLGRLFDAASALLGFVDTMNYEGEGPIKMEAAASEYLLELDGTTKTEALMSPAGGFPRGPNISVESLSLAGLLMLEGPGFRLLDNPKKDRRADLEVPEFYLDWGPVFTYIGKDLLNNRGPKENPAAMGLYFHRAVAEASLDAALRMREKTGISAIALSGGVFQNSLLLRLLKPLLEEAGFEVYGNRELPPGDGGIALGQVYLL